MLYMLIQYHTSTPLQISHIRQYLHVICCLEWPQKFVKISGLIQHIETLKCSARYESSGGRGIDGGVTGEAYEALGQIQRYSDFVPTALKSLDGRKLIVRINEGVCIYLLVLKRHIQHDTAASNASGSTPSGGMRTTFRTLGRNGVPSAVVKFISLNVQVFDAVVLERFSNQYKCLSNEICGCISKPPERHRWMIDRSIFRLVTPDPQPIQAEPTPIHT